MTNLQCPMFFQCAEVLYPSNPSKRGFTGFDTLDFVPSGGQINCLGRLFQPEQLAKHQDGFPLPRKYGFIYAG